MNLCTCSVCMKYYSRIAFSEAIETGCLGVYLDRVEEGCESASGFPASKSQLYFFEVNHNKAASSKSRVLCELKFSSDKQAAEHARKMSQENPGATVKFGKLIGKYYLPDDPEYTAL